MTSSPQSDTDEITITRALASNILHLLKGSDAPSARAQIIAILESKVRESRD